jgi:hypothetical protein
MPRQTADGAKKFPKQNEIELYKAFSNNDLCIRVGLRSLRGPCGKQKM